MNPIPELSINEAKERLDAGETLFVDIRDADSYQEAHIPGAIHVTNDNVFDFLDSTDKASPIVVYCYKGNSSLGGTAFFLEQGFQDVQSMLGGFDMWRLSYEYDSGNGA
jgi:thiosulfate sulfurtransferase